MKRISICCILNKNSAPFDFLDEFLTFLDRPNAYILETEEEKGLKTIGLIGGMSWESTLEYYRLINEGIKARLGGLHSARCVLYSVDFAEVESMQMKGQWDQAGRLLAHAAQRIDAAGADFVILCTNTMHRVADEIESRIHIPFLHIADATAHEIRKGGLRRVGLLGTRFTMEEDFYRGRLIDKYGLEVLVPPPSESELVHRVIYEELCVGRIESDSRQHYRAIMTGLAARGAEGIILGCTEIGLLVQAKDSPIPLFDTTLIHAQAAVDYALGA